jgi:hypothetical protein
VIKSGEICTQPGSNIFFKGLCLSVVCCVCVCVSVCVCVCVCTKPRTKCEQQRKFHVYLYYTFPVFFSLLFSVFVRVSILLTVCVDRT